MKPLRLLLAGNPNVGKSTVFNGLTGLRQHTGNWAGKTVEISEGSYSYKGREYLVEDLPGTYSLDACSWEEQVARDAIEAGDYDCLVVVCDGTCLRRNLILVCQLLALANKVVLAVNLMDEAERRGITVDCKKLERILGVPVVGTSAGRGQGIPELKEKVRMVAEEYLRPRPIEIPGDRKQRVILAEELAAQVVQGEDQGGKLQQRWDRLLTGRRTGIPIMLLLLFFLLWVTIAGANVPSEYIWKGVCGLYHMLTKDMAGMPWWIREPLLDGILLTAGRVIAVMLPPMAIFFPVFTLLEDLGYLPRVAYNLDHTMERCGACGKMALTMCMGLGCNAVGVTGCRIMDSPRERILGVVTNSLMPCNGRFAALILLMTAFVLPGGGNSAQAALGLTGLMLLSVVTTFGVSKLLSGTILRGMPSAFVLELPPFRKPQVAKTLIRSLIDRTLKVLSRAVVVSVPAGLLLWVLSAVQLGGESVLMGLGELLDPVGCALGMNGMILGAFLLGFPANEIVLPIVVMAVTGVSGMATGAALEQGLLLAGFDWKTALCTAVFFLFHWPCGTTCMTIYRETGSGKWLLLAILLPTAVGTLLCLLIHGLLHLL